MVVDKLLDLLIFDLLIRLYLIAAVQDIFTLVVNLVLFLSDLVVQ